MSDPLSRLRRRPFLVPLLLPLAFLLTVGLGLYWVHSWSRTTVVFFVRHAEIPADQKGDPDLNDAGEARAALLGAWLEDVLGGRPVDDLYSADTRRSQQTAAPVANQFRLPINLLAPSDWSELAARIRRDHRGETVVAVGYPQTLSAAVHELGGVEVVWAPDEFDKVYAVIMPSPGDPRVLRLRYGEPAAAAGKSPE